MKQEVSEDSGRLETRTGSVQETQTIKVRSNEKEDSFFMNKCTVLYYSDNL